MVFRPYRIIAYKDATILMEHTAVYQHRQAGTVFLVLFAVVLLFVVTVADLGKNLGWFLFTCGLLTAIALLFGSLTVMIRDGALSCRFGVGLIRRQFALVDITAVSAVRNHWHYGWGVRLTPGGWMFNVIGLDAVEITLVSGKRFRIGTNEPQQLVQAIQQNLGGTITEPTL